MTDQSTCQRCGAAVEDGALFCSKCGMDVTGGQGAPDATVEMAAIGEAAAPTQSTLRQTLREATTGEYEILNELGRGGMATVFLGHDRSLDRKVAIKVMSPHLLEGEGMAERFKLEARTAAQLSHPHIIPIYAVRETESTLFFIMKFIEGRGLDDIIRKSAPLPIPMVKDILTKVGAALGYAHRRNVVHRDVKPANIMIDDEGTPVVTDFGIAKVAAAGGLTMTGTTIGTPSYMSPEQCEAKPVTGASDQYSLGIVAFEMLTGKLPFEGDTAVSTMYKHCHEPLPPLQDFRPDCPPEVLETVNRMLAKNPAERWPSLEAAIQKLGASTDPHLDPIRSQLLELARDTDPKELLAQLTTPRTPMPGVTPATTAPGTVAAPATPRRSRAALVGTLATLSVIGVGTLAVLRPWQPDTPAQLVEGPLDGTGASNDGGDTEQPPADGGGSPEGGGEDGAAGAAADTVQPPAGGGQTGARPTDGAGGDRPAAGGDAPVTRPPVQPQPAAVATVRIEDAPTALEVDGEAQLRATALDASGVALQRGTVTWTSSDPQVGTVSTSGLFTALETGEVVVTAVVDGVRGSRPITVTEPTGRRVRVQPETLSLTVGEQARVTAEAQRRDGRPIPTRLIAWRSSDETVVAVTRDGEVQARGAGRATLTAAVLGARATVEVTVAAAEDARTAIQRILAEFEAAFESRDIARVRAVFPDMPSDRAEAFRATLAVMEDLDAQYTIGTVRENGDGAIAQVDAVYSFVDGQTRRRQNISQAFDFAFARTAAGWRLAGIRQR